MFYSSNIEYPVLVKKTSPHLTVWSNFEIVSVMLMTLPSQDASHYSPQTRGVVMLEHSNKSTYLSHIAQKKNKKMPTITRLCRLYFTTYSLQTDSNRTKLKSAVV